jgi:hypothetical protein
MRNGNITKNDLNLFNHLLDTCDSDQAILHYKFRDKLAFWNELVDDAKVFINSEVEPHIKFAKEKFNLDQRFVDSVRWDILNAIMEDSYAKCNYKGHFFHDLLSVYESGNFPCVWKGKWPKGTLLIY